MVISFGSGCLLPGPVCTGPRHRCHPTFCGYPDRRDRSTLGEGDAGWIARQQNSDGGWGIRRSEPSSLAHTAHAVEGLLAVGGYDQLLADARQWLMGKLPGAPLTPWDEHYQLSSGLIAQFSTNPGRSTRLRWTHLPTQRSLIALLRLGVDPDDEVITTLVADLAAHHEKGMCWRVQTVPDAAPSWAILESVNALALYQEMMKRTGPVVGFREVIRQIIPRMEALETQNEQLTAQVQSLLETVDSLSRHRHDWTRRLRRFVLAPRTQVAAVLVVTFSALVLYLQLWSRSADVGTRLIGVATIVGAALALLAMIKPKREPNV